LGSGFSQGLDRFSRRAEIIAMAARHSSNAIKPGRDLL
jgi:hypothetical protein